MRSFRSRRTAVALVIAIGLCAAFSAWAGPASFTAVLVPLWMVLPATPLVIARRRDDCPGEQPSSLFSLLLSRAPPAR